jgi:hypothetical protein
MSIITVELLFVILVLGIVCYARYGQLKNVRLFPGEYQRTWRDMMRDRRKTMK